MKNIIHTIAASLALLMLFGSAQSRGEVMTKEQVIAEGDKMAEAQLAILKGNYWGRFWVDGVMWAGIADFAKISPKGSKYQDEMEKMGNRGKWTLILNPKEPNHADDICIGYAFLDAYEKKKDPIMLQDVKARLDQASDLILSAEMEQKAAQAKNLPWNEGLTWYWCDALFMAPAVHARLSAITGDPKYLKAMHLEWKRTTDLLYDKEEHLFFRDAKYIPKLTKNGKKVFWARGDGWVVGALARVLPYIPKDDVLRPQYETLLREMCTKLASIQRPDGTWSPSLLDPDQFPYSETSGTALDCFAIAWGINNKVLDEKTFRPVVAKAWAALLAARRPDGLLGYVQGIGSEPAAVRTDFTVWYAQGAFLLAAAQVAQMAPIDVPPAPTLTALPPSTPTPTPTPSTTPAAPAASPANK